MLFLAIVLTDMPPIYLDHQATTPVDPRVLEDMRPYFSEQFSNAHANTYRGGLEARRATEKARRKLATTIGAHPKDIIFTSGATESNNIAILGIAEVASTSRRRIVTQPTEHKSVLGPIKALLDRGFEVVTVRVKRDGLVDLEELCQSVDETTLLVSMMLVNNETGVIQPVQKIAEICKRVGAFFHSDCAQALGKVKVNVNALNFDSASFSAHKAYGPKGIGALYIRRLRQAPISPITYGGGQEGGLRPGTLPVPLCVGFGKAAQLIQDEESEITEHLLMLEQRLWEGVKALVPSASRNGHDTFRAPGCFSMQFPGYQADALIDAWQGLEVAKGSACEATKLRSSHVLRSMGVSRTQADSSIRIGIGRFTSVQDIDETIAIIERSIGKIP